MISDKLRPKWEQDGNCNDGKSISAIQRSRVQAVLTRPRLAGHRVGRVRKSVQTEAGEFLAVAEFV